jgi:pyruvate/2-oxoglutarate dehydrogenase complex dihydrolipoamide acyltransferase (E2) component
MVELRMPALGNGVEDATISEWLFAVGERVAEGEAVVIVETDKASTELEAPVTGLLAAVHADDGSEVAVGDLLAVFEAA